MGCPGGGGRNIPGPEGAPLQSLKRKRGTRVSRLYAKRSQASHNERHATVIIQARPKNYTVSRTTRPPNESLTQLAAQEEEEAAALVAVEAIGYSCLVESLRALAAARTTLLGRAVAEGRTGSGSAAEERTYL